MVKAVFFDFDNTLFSNRTMSIPQSAKDAIRLLQAKGIHCVLATGRHMLELEHFPEIFTLNLDGFVTIDGQLCLDGKRNIICSNEIKGEALENLLSLFNGEEVPVNKAEAYRWYSKAAAQGEGEAQFILRKMFFEGDSGRFLRTIGLKRTSTKAKSLYSVRILIVSA